MSVKPEELYWAIDVSNYSGDISGQIELHQPERVIVRASHEDATRRQIAVDQCYEAYHDHGRGVDIYDWPYPGEDPAGKVHADLAIAAEARLPGIGMLMLDLEEYSIESLGPDGMCDWADAFARECMAVGVPCVLYTRRTFWIDYANDTDRCSWLYLCACQPDEIATLASVVPYGGWTHASGMIVGKQWSFAQNIDRDIIARSVYAPPTPPEPPPDPCAAEHARIEAVREYLRGAGPIDPEKALALLD